MSFFRDGAGVKTHLEATVEQSLIEIQNETFTAGMLRSEGRQQGAWDTILRLLGEA